MEVKSLKQKHFIWLFEKKITAVNNLIEFLNYLEFFNPIQVCLRIGGLLPPPLPSPSPHPSHTHTHIHTLLNSKSATHPTMIKLGTNMPYL